MLRNSQPFSRLLGARSAHAARSHGRSKSASLLTLTAAVKVLRQPQSRGVDEPHPRTVRKLVEVLKVDAAEPIGYRPTTYSEPVPARPLLGIFSNMSNVGQENKAEYRSGALPASTASFFACIHPRAYLNQIKNENRSSRGDLLGVLASIVRGCSECMREGLKAPEEVRQATREGCGQVPARVAGRDIHSGTLPSSR